MKSQQFLGELVFETRAKGIAVVRVYRGESTFTLSRTIKGEVTEEASKADAHGGDVAGYIAEAAQRWADLKREDVKWKPHSATLEVGNRDVGTF